MFSLTGKNALVTGATGYLGTAMVKGLAKLGAHVYVNSSSQERCDGLVKALRQDGYSVDAAPFDVCSSNEINEFFASYLPSELHVVVNNAYKGVGGTMETASASQYHDAYEVTAVAAHNIINAALPFLRNAVKNSGDASVINIASMYGIVSPDFRVYESAVGTNPPFYGAAKAALIQLTKYAACEFGPEGIRCNSVSPGPFPSHEAQEANPNLIASLNEKTPLGRIGQSDEIMGPVAFLASPAASFVNGADLRVDGGWTSW